MTAPVFGSPVGQELLKVLQQHGLPQHAIATVAELVAKLVAEGQQQRRQDWQQQPDQQQQQAPKQRQQQQPACAAPQQPRDLQQADVVLRAVPFISPRGKFDVAFFEDCLQLTNKQTWAAVAYNAIQHVLVIDAIPKQPDTTNVVLVMKSGQPVQQGKNRHDIIVMQTKDSPELSLPAPPACAHLGDMLAGAAAVVVSQLLATYLPGLADDTFLTADADVFSSAAGDLMVAANRGAQPGWLVPLSAGLCYIGKGGCFVGCSSISKVLLHRTGGSSSTFDITVMLRRSTGGDRAAAAGPPPPPPLELGQIDAAELARLQAYLQRQHIRVGSPDDGSDDDDDDGAGVNGAAAGGGGAAGDAAVAAADDDDDDEEDGDYDPAATGSRKRRRSSAGGEADEGGDEDDDEEEDEGEGGSGSGDTVGSDSDDEVSLVDEGALDDDDDEDDAFE